MASFKQIILPVALSSVVLMLLSVTTCKHQIESDLITRTTQSLDEKSLNNLEIKASGRDLSLTVDYQDKNKSDAILSETLATHGVRVATVNHRAIRPLIERADEVLEQSPYRQWVSVKAEGENALVLNGSIPETVDVPSLISAFEELEGLENINNQLQADKSFKSQADVIINRFNLPWLSYEINDDKITLFGETVNEDEKNRIISSFSDINGIRQIDDKINLVTKLNVDDCQTELNKLLNEETILFELSSSSVDKESLRLIASLSNMIRRCQDTNIEIAGHTDNTGPRSLNKVISLERAQSVMEKLIDLGIDENRLVAVGYGDEIPIVSNNSEENRAKNRRIEFKVSSSQ